LNLTRKGRNVALKMLKAVRREMILRSALDIVQEAGFPALTLAAVAVRCDCGLKTVKRQFPTLTSLCLSLVDYAEVVGDAETVKTGRRLFPVDTVSQP
jgi:AcrR family transcriptional regulator